MDFGKKQEELLKFAYDNTKKPIFTLVDCVKTPSVAWEVLGLLSKSNMIDDEAVAFVNEDKDKYRTIFSTVKDMASLRKKFDKMADGETSDDYQEFYDNIVMTIDTYASKVICDLYAEYGEIVLEIATNEKMKKKQAGIERAAKAREGRKKTE